MSPTSRTTYRVDPDLLNRVLGDTRSLVEAGVPGGSEALYGLLRKPYSLYGASDFDADPVLAATSSLRHVRLRAGWSVLGYLLLLDRFEEARQQAKRSLALFGVDAEAGSVERILHEVPWEVARAPETVGAWQDWHALSYPDDSTRGAIDADGEPDGITGLLSYAIARAAVPVLRFSAEGPPAASLIRETLGKRRWQNLLDEAKRRGLKERLALGFMLPEGPFARALLVPGTEADAVARHRDFTLVAGLPEQLDWARYVEDFEQTLLDEPDLFLMSPF